MKIKRINSKTSKFGIYHKHSLLPAFLIGFMLCMLLFTQAFSPVVFAAGESGMEEQTDFLEKLIRFVEANYYEEIDLQQLIDGAYKGVFNQLDPYSSYYTEEEYEQFDAQVTGTFGGIGVQMAVRDGFVTVIAPLDGTPAHRAGIKAGDRVVFVDGIDVRDISLDKVAGMMRGEPGTKVKIGIFRQGQPLVIDFELTREIIEINPVTYEVLEETIGYIRLSDFNEHSGENVYKALDYFDELGIKDIILDLRDNPGGIVQQSVDIAVKFVPEGPVVHVDRRNAKRQTYKSRLKEPKYNLVVLVNGGSASASEIVAGAVQDTGAGILVGTQTFGKGTVQQVIPLANDGLVKMTIAKYLTPNGRIIDGEGITPDIIVENQGPEGKYQGELAPIKSDRKFYINSVGLGILGAEQRLDTMGYSVGEVDGVFDYMLEQAVARFQSDTGLYAYGVLDITTQQKLLEEYQEYIEQSATDAQLEKAIEIIKSER